MPKQNDDDAEEEEENEIEEGGGTQEEVEKKKWWEDVVGWVLRNGEQTEVGRAEQLDLTAVTSLEMRRARKQRP